MSSETVGGDKMLKRFFPPAPDMDVAMARTSNTVSPEIASKLADVARELREHIYGQQACPEWGTRFTQIEDQGMQVGLELARLFMQQSVQHQADGEIPPQAVDCDGEQAVIDKNRQHETTLDTPAGQVEWKQPKTRLKKSRRDFFPSGSSAGT
jgi:hypothetical protein